MHQIKIISLLFILIIGSAFGQNNELIKETIESDDQMVFLSFHISESDDDKVNITFKDKYITDGLIKGFDGDTEFDEAGNIVVSLLDKDLNTLEILYVKNPLEKVVEFVNELGNLEKRLMLSKETDFMVRMPYSEAVKNIRFQLLSNSDVTNPTILKL